MVEQSYEISSPLSSPFFVDFLEEHNNKISNETSSTNDIYFEENQETFKQDKVIDNLKHTKFTPCVVIDFINGEIKRCGGSTKLRQLRNLFGT